MSAYKAFKKLCTFFYRILNTWYSVNSAVNHNSTRFNPISLDHFSLSNRHHQDIRLSTLKNRLAINLKRTKLGQTFSFKFFVFEWHTETVAWFHFRSSDAGVPTILLLPRTTASDPAMVVPLLLISSITPLGVQGRKDDRSPTATLPSLIVLRLK